ncbi:MAG: RAM signaling network component [Cirrosporium novae-zelandiae]|nr:MAG: RAM signaling network component [Cirrosporium novae-zelandiae]
MADQPRTMMRPPTRSDHSRNGSRDTKEGSHSPAGSSYSGIYPPDYESQYGDQNSSTETLSKAIARPGEETIELFRQGVENARKDTQRSLGVTEGLSEVVQPKLTVDLGHQRIGVIPEEVVDLIRDEVERLSLSHNQIPRMPNSLSECTQLQYLNIRANRFTEFPTAVLKLQLLKILDISKNKIRKIPDEVGKLTSLRVFSVQYNYLEELPLCLGDMQNLRIIKTTGNPLKPTLKSLIETKSAEVDPTVPENVKDQAVTVDIKHYLKRRLMSKYSNSESGGESSEGTLDTPRPLMRGLSVRFPVVPINDSVSGADSRSPAGLVRPPIPTKSHHRLASGQQGVAINGLQRRPSISPLTNGNGSERIRSNSESVLQASQVARSRRLANNMRKPSELSTVPEARINRYSHIRGLSHNSALREKSAGFSISINGSPSPITPVDRQLARGTWVQRLSSLPEQKTDSPSPSQSMCEGIKGVLYALYEIHPHVVSCINAMTDDETSKRNSLEIVFYNASGYINRLDQELTKYSQLGEADGDIQPSSGTAIKKACLESIKAYVHVCNQMKQNIDKIVEDGDQRYVRTLLRSIYGTLIETRNACSNLKSGQRSPPATVRAPSRQRSFRGPPLAARPHVPSITPTPQPRRLRADTGKHYSPAHQSTSNYQPPVPLFVGSRSRSNSRTTLPPPGSSASSVVNTPRSARSSEFSTLGSSVSSLREINGQATSVNDYEEDRAFEEIFFQLKQACDTLLKILPIVQYQLKEAADMPISREGLGIVEATWRSIFRSCDKCIEYGDALRIRLGTVGLKEPSGSRGKPDFWHLCNLFVRSWTEIMMEMKEAKMKGLVPKEVVELLRPVHASVKLASKLMDRSPWAPLVTQSSNSIQQNVGNYRSNSSPSNAAPTPATPLLNAALGPAAQATVPSTPASTVSTFSERMFDGDFFQRADSFLRMPHAVPQVMQQRR